MLLLLLLPPPLRLSDDTASRSLLLQAPAPLWTLAIAALLEPAGGEGIGMAGAAAAPGPADLERAGHHDIYFVCSFGMIFYKQQMRSELPNPINNQAPKSTQIAVLQWYKYTYV